MRILIVGAGATGSYLAALLAAGGRDVTMLVRDGTRRRVDQHGLRFRSAGGELSQSSVRAVTRTDLDSIFDIVVVAVRSDAVAAGIADFAPAVGGHTHVVPLGNGLDQLDRLAEKFGSARVVGAAARMATSLAGDGIVDVISPGVALEIGSLRGTSSEALSALVAELTVDGVDVEIRDDIELALWHKFLFITATATLTCLARDVIGTVVAAQGGGLLAERILTEVNAVAEAVTDGAVGVPAALRTALTDPTSRFGPSMFRDLVAGRRVEGSVLAELSRRGRRHHLDTPLLDAAVVAVELHNHRISLRDKGERP
ncbi:MAG: 2-dehydropantoate 2-reductase [Mycobacterium sp.]